MCFVTKFEIRTEIWRKTYILLPCFLEILPWLPIMPLQTWTRWFLRRGENQSTRRKTSRSKVENQQQTQSSHIGGRRALSQLCHHCSPLRRVKLRYFHWGDIYIYDVMFDIMVYDRNIFGNHNCSSSVQLDMPNEWVIELNTLREILAKFYFYKQLRIIL